MIKSEHFSCPYNECNKEFEKPLMLTDFSMTPRETYYACPHCLTRVDVSVNNENPTAASVISIEPSEDAQKKAPPECQFKFGHLGSTTTNAPIPDGCLTCSRLLKCIAKKETQVKGET